LPLQLGKNREGCIIHPYDKRKNSKNDRARNRNSPKSICPEQIPHPQTVNELIGSLEQISDQNRKREGNELLPDRAGRKILLLHRKDILSALFFGDSPFIIYAWFG